MSKKFALNSDSLSDEESEIPLTRNWIISPGCLSAWLKSYMFAETATRGVL